MNEKWVPGTYRNWGEFPIGTKAKAYGGGWWIKTPLGWKWCTGATFPSPGGDANGEVCLPDPNDPDVIKALKIVPRKPY